MGHQAYQILAIDDLADNLFLLQVILEAEGYEVEIANSGTSALDMLEELHPDLILLDLMMPDMNGYEVTKRIRQKQRFASVPILLVTAHTESSASQGLAVGANDFIRKPIDCNDLIAKIRSHLPFTLKTTPRAVNS